MVSMARFSSSGVIFFCFCAVVKMPMPKGLVRYILSPTLAVEFSFKCLIATLPVTAKPKMGSGASIL
jgi:hypothetical protein